jgi:hypothetical protein
MSANDPKRTWAVQDFCSEECLSCRQTLLGDSLQIQCQGRAARTSVCSGASPKSRHQPPADPGRVVAVAGQLRQQHAILGDGAVE